MSYNQKELPIKWTIKCIEEIFAPLEDGRTLHQGWSPQCEKEPSPSEDIWGVLKTTSIQAGEFQPEHNKRLPADLQPRSQIEVKKGDLLLTCAGPRVRCGVACLVRQTRKRLMISGKMYRFRVDPAEYDARFIEAFLQTEQARLAIDKMKTGSSDSGLNLTHERFRQLSVPIPPTLYDQRRIVAEIEKHFTRLAAGIAALRRVQANLKRYRAAVLKAACEGRLVENEVSMKKAEGQSVETGEQLLQRILTERRKNWQGRGKYKEPVAPDTANLPILPEGWVWVTWDMVLATEDGAFKRGPFGSALKKSIFVKEGFKVYEQYCPINDDCSYARYYITADKFEEMKSFEVKAGDYLISCSGVTLGRITRVPANSERGIINQALLRVRMNDHLIDHRYFLHLFRSVPFQKAIFDNSTGSAIPNVKGVKELKAMVIPLPPLAEQTRIVAEVERRLSVVDEMETVVSANLQRASRLRQSILQRAFAGELV